MMNKSNKLFNRNNKAFSYPKSVGVTTIFNSPLAEVLNLLQFLTLASGLSDKGENTLCFWEHQQKLKLRPILYLKANGE